jgi:hypothetical protein
MVGLAFQTKDGWVYTAPDLIQKKSYVLIWSIQLQDDDVNVKSKSNALEKAFSVLQSVCVNCIILARAVSSLLICPFDLGTLHSSAGLSRCDKLLTAHLD